MNFWDTSAIIPLLISENDTSLRESQLRADPDLLVWYGAHAEIESAICRRLRENAMDAGLAAQARARLQILAKSWLEVQPTPHVKARAIRLLRVHPLRAADSFQLAAALTAFDEITAGNLFLTASPPPHPSKASTCNDSISSSPFFLPTLLSSSFQPLRTCLKNARRQGSTSGRSARMGRE